MSDLISRKKAIHELMEYITEPQISDDESTIEGYNHGLETAISVLAELPSTTQPEIIRCIECVHWDWFPRRTVVLDTHRCNAHSMGKTFTRYDEYCSLAERRNATGDVKAFDELLSNAET